MTPKQEAAARKRAANARLKQAKQAFAHAENAYILGADLLREHPDEAMRHQLDQYHGVFRRLRQDAEREVAGE